MESEQNQRREWKVSEGSESDVQGTKSKGRKDSEECQKHDNQVGECRLQIQPNRKYP